jgi:LuxR family transcriptional regulator, maltose regulon positive regulatory protein
MMTKTEPSVSLLPPDTIPGNILRRTKFFRPRALSDVISRDRFLGGLNSGLGGKITLVCAPAGFGKTTLLVEWLESSGRSSAWFSLDERDNELPIFVHAFATSVRTIFPDACQNTASLLTARQLPSLEQLATLIINDLADIPETEAFLTRV